MLPPTVKQFFFKLLISIFVHDYKNVLGNIDKPTRLNVKWNNI